MKRAVFFILAVLMTCVASYFAGRVKGCRIGWEKGAEAGYAAGYAAVHPSDTLVRVDTLLIDRPVPVSSIPAGVELLPVGTLAQMQARIDSLLAVQPDTAFVEIPVPIETKRYGGRPGDEYEAQVSGWHPSLDWIEVFAKTTTITKIETVGRKRIGWGVTAGPGLLYDGNLHAGLGIVAGVQYRF